MGQATEKQTTLIKSLLDEREVGSTEALIRGALDSGSLDIRSASEFITKLFAAPRKPKAAPAESPWTKANAALAKVEISFYAIPAGYVTAQRIDLYGSDYLFVRVRNYQGKRYISRVHGAPGSPRYSRIDPVTTLALATIMQDRHVEFAALWHEHSGRCGRCNATLTDQVSREKGLGPDCAKVWGL